ncbi:hypothetical protein Hdeb2414_s0001g00012111 [Helianthus debilis subsp. tardiflorus]
MYIVYAILITLAGNLRGRNASAQGHMKLKLYVSGRRSISHTTFKARSRGNINGHDNNDANLVSGRRFHNSRYLV